MTQRRTVSPKAAKKAEEELKRKEAALEKINEKPELLALYNAERDAYARQTEDNLLFYWARGQVARDLKQTNVYGQGAIDLMADALGVDRSLVYKTATLAEMYPEQETLQAKMAEAIEKDWRLTWSHLSIIVHVPLAKSGSDPHAKRHAMVQMLIDNKLTVRAVGEEIKDRYGDEIDDEDDNPVTPKSITGLLKQLEGLAVKGHAKLEEVLASTVTRLEATTGANIKPEQLEKVTADKEALKKLGEQATAAARTLEAHERRLTREKAAADRAPAASAPSAPAGGGRAPSGNGRRPAAAAARGRR